MYICLYDKLLSKDIFKEEYINSINSEKICIYNSEKKSFHDTDGKQIDLQNQIIFPISGINQVKEIRDAANRFEIKCFVTEEDDCKVKSWAKYYKPIRKIKEITGLELTKIETIKQLEEEFGKEFFFKTKKKNYSANCNIDYLKNKNSILFKALEKHSSKEFIISEKVNILADKLGKLEFRCVVINGKARNISRITEDIIHKIDEKVKVKLEQIVEKLNSTDFPNSYVVDLMIYEDNDEEVIDVIEFNSICSSGMYLYNSIVDLDNSNILHDDQYRLPKNKKYKKDVLKEDGVINMMASKLFDIPNGFAETVKEYTGVLIGAFIHSFNSLKEARYFDDSCLGDNYKIKKLSDLFDNLTLVESESDLNSDSSRKLK